MPHVHLLDDDLINKIAAGEVVERPASVVKELVENAIDAGATQIDIRLDDGGRQLISVQDNGVGMSSEDAVLAVKRHTTSKISRLDDLFQVATMGFRGEALASIAAVSHFTLMSQTAGHRDGVRLELGPKDEVKRSDYTGTVGSHILVRDLFYNVPARQAFLRSAATEFSHCQEYLVSLALARPDIGFSLNHNGRDVFRVERACSAAEQPWGAKPLKKRVAELFKKEDLASLLYFEYKDKYGLVEGLASPPGMERGSAKFMYSFVNHRWVRDKVLRYGILRGYHSHLLKGRYPTCFLYLHIDPTLVDVNVHPAKAEVRFQYTNEVQSIIALAIRDTIRKGAWSKPDFLQSPATEDGSESKSSTSSLVSGVQVTDQSRKAPTGQPQTSPALGPETDFDLAFTKIKPTVVAESLGDSPQPVSRKLTGRSEPSGEKRVSRMRFASESDFKRQATESDRVVTDEAIREDISFQFASSFDEPKIPSRQTESNFKIDFSELSYLGCFASCYLMFDAGDQLLVIDQHAFHERILFERLLQDPGLLRSSQPLLVPELIDLSASDAELLRKEKDHLEELGIRYALLDDGQIEIRAVPSLLANRDLEAFVQELVKSLATGASKDALVQSMHQIFSTIACHAAVRAGEHLSDEDLGVLLNEGSKVDFYHNCPHGRRVLRWWKRNEVEAWFDR